MGRFARKILFVGLALGLLSLASCVPPPNPYKSTQSGAATLGSSSSYGSSSYGSSSYAGSGSYAGGTQYHFSADAPVSNSESEALTQYLHSHRLPMVGGRVLANDGTGTRKAILYGFVATPFGKSDAVAKARRFLNDPGAEIDNRIMIKPELAASGSGSSAGSTPNEVKSYEEQQRLAQQQQQQQQQYMSQQYQNQGSAASLLPFLMLQMLMGSSFGSGGSNFSFGAGTANPYGGYPSYPPPSYGYPPSPYPPSYAPPPYGPSYP